MPCKGICEQYKVKRPHSDTTRYESGQKRYNMCDVFTKWDGIRCPCCGSMLRTKPKNARHRIRIMQQVKRI